MTEIEGLRFIASAIAGIDVGVAALERPGPAWTNGATIFVDASASRSVQIESLSVQASLIAQRSLTRDRVFELARRPALARRYLTVEGHRALAANAHVLPRSVARIIDTGLASRVQSPEDSLQLAQDDRRVADPPLSFGTIRPRKLRSLVDDDDAAHANEAASGRPPAHARTSAHTELDEDDTDDDDLGSLLASPVGGGGPVGKLLSKLLASTRKRGSGTPGAEVPTHVGGAHTRTRSHVAANAPAGDLDRLPALESKLTYPEWDANRRRYRADWCTVVDTDGPLHPGVSTTIPDVAALRRALGRLGMELAPARRRRQGEDLDIDAVVEARVQTLAGVANSDALYLESIRQRRDLAVLVLLDVSGSAEEQAADGRRVHDHQQQLALQLTAALHGLGDRVALYAFNSRGRAAVQMFRVKSFDGAFDASVLQRANSLSPGAYTRLGAAIRHGTAIVEEHAGTPRQLLVVVSDGFAYDHGYAGSYGEADARCALLEARRRGVGCLCLSVATDTEPAALRRVFGSAAHARLSSVQALPRVAGPLFRAALRSADTQRRTFQRKERSRELLGVGRSAAQ